MVASQPKGKWRGMRLRCLVDRSVRHPVLQLLDSLADAPPYRAAGGVALFGQALARASASLTAASPYCRIINCAERQMSMSGIMAGGQRR